MSQPHWNASSVLSTTHIGSPLFLARHPSPVKSVCFTYDTVSSETKNKRGATLRHPCAPAYLTRFSTRFAFSHPDDPCIAGMFISTQLSLKRYFDILLSYP